MKYYLGIDGGGTKTTFTIITEDNEIVYRKTLGPTSIDTVSMDVTINTFKEGLKDLPYQVDGVFAGVGGVISETDKQTINQIINDNLPYLSLKHIGSDNDVVNALYGGIEGNDGIIVICGTGSVAYGKYNNQTFRCGGYSYLEGDAGSAYDLGISGIRILARVIDNRLKPSPLTDALKEATNTYDQISLIKYITSSTRTKVASLAKVITEHQDDEYAKKIIDKATDEIVLLIKAVYNTLSFKEDVKFSIIGSLGNADTLYKKLLLTKLNNTLPKIKFIPKIYEADFGACLKAKELSL